MGGSITTAVCTLTLGLVCDPTLCPPNDGGGCACIQVFQPVCCDGVTYGNRCMAACACVTGFCLPGECPTDDTDSNETMSILAYEAEESSVAEPAQP